jgi:hypothetical protein
MTPEEKLLRLVLKEHMDDRNYPVKQEIPFCPRCQIEIDILDDSVKVDYRDAELNGKTYTFAEPYCPQCFTKIEAKIYLVS